MEEVISPKHGQVLSTGIYQLLLQRRMLDVTITCGGEAIMAHKAVLVAFSKFLDTVFSGQGDDCDVLNMDNLGLDFEAIRAVIFFMYKGAVDMDRCGEEAFHTAARVLAVDTTTQYTKPEPDQEASSSTTAPPQVAVRNDPPAQPQEESSSSFKKKTFKEQMTMTDTPRVLKLTRFTQTERRLTGLAINVDDASAKRAAVTSTGTQTFRVGNQITQGSQTASPLLVDLGLKENTSDSKIVTSSPKTPAGKRKADSPKTETRTTRGSVGKTGGMPIVNLQKSKKRKIEEDEEEPQPSTSFDDDYDDFNDADYVEDDDDQVDEIGAALDSMNSPAKSPTKSRVTRSAQKPTEIKQEPETPTIPAKRGRGRPRKNATPVQTPTAKPTPKSTSKSTPKVKEEPMEDSPNEDGEPEETPRRGRGRPRKIKTTQKDEDFDWMGTPTLRRSTTPKGQGSRGRKPGPGPASDLYSEEKRSMWKKDDDGNFQCLQCDWSRTTSKSLLVHLRIHLDERPFICEVCGKGFRTTDKLRDHNRTHTGERPYLCSECSRTFKTSKALIRHRFVHTTDKYHKCEQCDKAFYTRDRLNQHVNIVHKKIKKFGCSLVDCDYRAADKKSILYHEAEKHGHPLPATLVTMCDICGMSIRNSSLRMHMLIHTAKTLRCPECGFATQYKNTLNGHMQRLHGTNIDGTVAVKPYACGKCDQSFFSRQQLRFHEMRHRGAKPHKCPICNFSTVDKGSMNMHIRTHTGATPYSCKHCPKSFKQSSALCWHTKTVHEGVRRFTCEECQRTYVNKKDLRAHRFSVHLKIKPFSCPNCHYSCTKKDYLAQHIEKTHGAHLVPKELLPVRTFKRGPDRKILNDNVALNIVPDYNPDEDLRHAVIEAGYEVTQQGPAHHPVVLVDQETLKTMEQVEGIQPKGEEERDIDLDREAEAEEDEDGEEMEREDVVLVGNQLEIEETEVKFEEQHVDESEIKIQIL